jgi:hypothetical protein
MQVTEKKLAVSQEAVEALTFKILFKNIAEGIIITLDFYLVLFFELSEVGNPALMRNSVQSM